MVMTIYKSCAVALLCAAGTFAAAGTEAAGDPLGSKAVARYTQAIIDRLDADKDGDVSKAEFMDFMSKEFDRLDVNHDGKLQQKEILNKEIIGPGVYRSPAPRRNP